MVLKPNVILQIKLLVVVFIIVNYLSSLFLKLLGVSVESRGVFRILSDINDGGFLRKYLTTFSR